MRTRLLVLVIIAGPVAGGSLLALGGCDRPVTPVPPPRDIVAYSASPFAIDATFDRPLDRTSASQASHYFVTNAAGGRLVPIRAAWVDTLFGQTVRLLFRLGTFSDSTRYSLTVGGIRDAWGQPLFGTDSASVEIHTGLGYSYPIRELLDRKCTPCHDGRRAGGSYRTDGYEALFDLGSDAGSPTPRPNVIPGDARSLLVIRTTALHSMFNIAHLNYGESQLFLNWVVTYQARR